MPDDRFERLANLVTYLLDAGERGRNGTTYADIMAAIPGYPEGDDARRRAFERDKKLLRDEDIPLVEEDGRYWIPPAEYYLPDLGLSEDEQLALQLAVAAVPVAGDQGGAALQKLTLGADLDGAGAGPAGAPFADIEEHPLLPILHGAIRRRATVTFTHRGAERTVEPSLLFFREGNWYLFGFDRLRDAERNFRIDRIEGSVDVGAAGSFERRAPAAAGGGSDAMPREPWLFGGADDPAPEEAVVRVDAVLAAKAVADAGASASVERHADGTVTLTMPVRQRGPFRSWVLGLLDHAEVVGPPALRDDLVVWLRAIGGAG
ncbi:MAG TPA: WYL domain-containing protein [Acidimicrobiales bacterium]|nr:WYL domain-containing protein [Acidimicrobiales bacterium]